MTDQLGRQIAFEQLPMRIVSLVPSQTELLVDLGLEEQLVGLTKFCVHPADLRKKKTVVGGTKTLHFDKIRALDPDVILCNKEENTKEIIYTLEKEFLVHISDISSLKDAYEMIAQYGEMFDVAKKAVELIDDIKQEVAEFQKFIADEPRLKVAYFIWRRPWMVVGGNTFVNHLLQMNNFENVYGSLPRYPEVDLERLKKTDLMLLSSEPFPFAEKHKKELEPYAGTAKITFVDGEYFSWYGSRLEAAFRYFRKWRETL